MAEADTEFCKVLGDFFQNSSYKCTLVIDLGTCMETVVALLYRYRWFI